MHDAVPVVALIMVTVLGFPFMAALAHRFAQSSKRALDGPGMDQLRDELREIQDRLDAIEADTGRITELEERLDFAERVLAQRDRPKIGQPDASEAPK